MNPWVGALLVIFALAPQGIERALEVQLRRRLPAEMKWKALAFDWSQAPRSVTVQFAEPSWNSGSERTTAIAAEATSLRAAISFAEWKTPSLTSIEVATPSVVITEGDEKTSPTPPSSGATETPPITLPTVRAENGRFIYRRLRKPQNAEIQIDGIDAHISRAGTRAQASGRLEKSGLFQLKIELEPLFGSSAAAQSNALKLDVDLEIKNHSMPSLNRFFSANDGIQFRGMLQRGRAQVAVRNRRATGTADVRYSDFKIHFQNNRQRGGFSALLMNVGAFARLHRHLDSQRYDRKHKPLPEIHLERRPDETLISFILRAMKESALGQAIR